MGNKRSSQHLTSSHFKKDPFRFFFNVQLSLEMTLKKNNFQ